MCGGGMFRRAMRVAPLAETVRPQERRPQTVQPQPATLPASPAAPAATQITCSLCGRQTQAEFSWCPHCGAALQPQPCVYCGQELQPADANCPACGAPRQRRRA